MNTNPHTSNAPAETNADPLHDTRKRRLVRRVRARNAARQLAQFADVLTDRDRGQLLRTVRGLEGDAILRDGNVVHVRPDGELWCMTMLPRELRLRQAAEACESALRDVYAADKVLLRIPTVAAATDTPVETVKHWIRTGLLPRVKIGRSVYVARDDLVAFVDRHRNGSGNGDG